MISLTPSFFVVLLVVMENAAVPTDGKSDRILGGKKASITEFPSMAFLEHVKFNGYYSCGATIISDRWILTAGHCVEGVHASNVTLKVGSEEKGRGILRRASRIIMHEEYIHERDHGLVNIQNDIAVAEVEKPFPLNDFTIKAARLATQETDIPLGNFVTAVGWGSIGVSITS
ncbi:mite allergen Eur m 3 [Anabrus simplex]|uniref:mite allergen Eur m 3 n=1 Tax=Anabrus simplex TaxID=316456 RepID=UPI0035A33F25